MFMKSLSVLTVFFSLNYLNKRSLYGCVDAVTFAVRRGYLFPFSFVPLTLGLSLLLAVMETRYARTKDLTYQQMAQFWGKIFLINFVVGIVTGITLEFQFGTNWSRYSRFVGDIFGSILAIEATVAFFWNQRLSQSGLWDGNGSPRKLMR